MVYGVKYFISTLIFSAVLSVVVSMPALASADEAPATIVIGCGFDVMGLDPAHAYEYYCNMVMYALYDNLLQVQPGSDEPVPCLATSYDIADGQSTPENISKEILYVRIKQVIFNYRKLDKSNHILFATFKYKLCQINNYFRKTKHV